MDKVKLNIVGLSYSQTQSGAYALVLGEDQGKRRLPIIIGGFEAQAIAIELEDMTPTRPLTHDLFKSFAESFEIGVKEVIIYNLVEGIFYAKLICEYNGKETEVDARTSDAIALSVRFKCPVYTYEFILSSAGIILDEEGEPTNAEDTKPKAKPKKQKSITDLETQLNDALAKEDYEKASRLRDQINERKKNEQ
jgi:bifunctional DNase/RNase